LPFVGAVLQPGRRLQVVHRDLEGSLVVVEANDKDLVLGDEQPPWWEEGIAIAAEAEDSSVHRREEDIAPDTSKTYEGQIWCIVGHHHVPLFSTYLRLLLIGIVGIPVRWVWWSWWSWWSSLSSLARSLPGGRLA
jgi:hypothetical protein